MPYIEIRQKRVKDLVAGDVIRRPQYAKRFSRGRDRATEEAAAGPPDVAWCRVLEVWTVASPAVIPRWVRELLLAAGADGRDVFVRWALDDDRRTDVEGSAAEWFTNPYQLITVQAEVP
jgi:hypothetical protein